jgi:RNA polymerase sigma factor (TIGR02999 family)
MPLLYQELRKLAASHLRRTPGYNTLQPTALIHEAWIRLADQTSVCAEDRVHFYGICSRLMRLILVDHIREKNAGKRGGGAERVELNEAVAGAPSQGRDIETLHLALEALEKFDPRKAQIIELRYFGGLTAEEIAAHLNIGTATVARDLRAGQAWLAREISGPAR